MPFKFFPTAEHHLREDVLSFTGKPTSQTRSNEAAPMVKPHISMQNTAHKMQTSARSDVQRITGRGPIFAGLGPTLIEREQKNGTGPVANRLSRAHGCA